MDTVDKTWREILSSENQRTIIFLLERSLTSVLRFADELGFVKLGEGELATVKGCDELGDIRKIYAQKYGREEIKLLDIKKKFLNRTKPGSRQQDIRPEEAKRIVNLIEVSYNAATSLRYFRNLWAHKNTPVDDPGHATALAGTVLHLIEQINPEGDDLKTRVGKLREDTLVTLKLSSAFYEEDDEKQEDSCRDQMALEEEKEGTDILLEKLEEFRSEWDAVKTLLHRVPDEIQMRLLASNTATQSPKKNLESLNKEELSEFSDEEKSNRFDTDEFEGDDVVSPSLTPIQAENRLIALRNRISSEFRWNNAPIKPWENVLQRPLIEQVIQEKIQDAEQWKNTGGKIKERYTDKRNSSEAMDGQLRKYGGEIFDIIKSIEDIPF